MLLLSMIKAASILSVYHNNKHLKLNNIFLDLMGEEKKFILEIEKLNQKILFVSSYTRSN
jgi:hypothetical protein